MQMNTINTNAVNVVNEQWDYLIVLDACRYDFFERQYSRHLEGQLSKKISLGGSTPEWRNNAFPGRYDDIIYITSNPMINAAQDVYGYRAGEHFGRVVEVWKDGWDEDRGTVMPDMVTNAAIDVIEKNPETRCVIHYLQPHAPYVGSDIPSTGHSSAERFGRGLSCGEQDNSVPAFKRKVLALLLRLFRENNLLGNHPEWFLRKWLNIPAMSPLENALRSLGREGLKRAYQANLDLVLGQVAVLIEHLSGTIVVTADHGELLGENRCYGHPPKSANPIQFEVPWLVIKKKNKITRPATEAAANIPTPAEQDTSEPAGKVDQEVIERLRALGYYD